MRSAVLVLLGSLAPTLISGAVMIQGTDSMAREMLIAYEAFLDQNPTLEAYDDYQSIGRGSVQVLVQITTRKPASGSGYLRTDDGQTLIICIWHLGNQCVRHKELWLSLEGKLAHEFHHAAQFLRGHLGFFRAGATWSLYAYDLYDEYDAFRVQYETIRTRNPKHPDLARGILGRFARHEQGDDIIQELSKACLYGGKVGSAPVRRAVTQCIVGLEQGAMYRNNRWFFFTSGAATPSTGDPEGDGLASMTALAGSERGR